MTRQEMDLTKLPIVMLMIIEITRARKLMHFYIDYNV